MITIFKNRFESKNPAFYPLQFILDRIKNGNSKDSILKYASTGDTKYKLDLPCIVFQGKFSARNKHSCIESSGLACLDFDNLSDAVAYKEQLKNNKYVYVAFISPSANGVKVLVKIPAEVDMYEQYYKALLEHFVDADKATKDISRVCFESYDPDLYINNNSEIWSDVLEDITTLDNTVPDLPLTDESKIIDKLRVWLDKNFPIEAGNRSNNLYKFASACNDYGVSKGLCEFYSVSNFEQEGFTANEIKQVITSAYRNSSSHGTKFFDDIKTVSIAKKLVRAKKQDNEIKQVLISSGLDDNLAAKALELAKEQTKGNLLKFWSEKVDKAGNVKYELERISFIEFLTQQGFYRYSVGTSGYIFIKVYNNTVKPVELHDIKSYVFDYVDQHYSVDIMEFLARGVKTYFTKDLIELLEFYDYYQHRSNKDISYFYFQNKVIKVSKNDFEFLDYIDLDGFVWESHIIKRDYIHQQQSKGDFVQFLLNVSGGEDENRFNAFCSAIGFLLHDHKDKSYCPSIILNDEKLSDNPEGGTGKGLFMKAIGYFKRSITIDGKGFKFDKSFVWQRVNIDTQLINFEDVQKGFDFERLFSLITEGIPVEKKGLLEFYLPFDNSPKICITTNYAIKGDGNSFARRKFEVEFAQHYTKSFTPLHDFGRVMFDGWDSEEWARFDFFMLSCVQFYLSNGLVEYEHINLRYKKLISETCIEFVEFIDEVYKVNERFILKDYKDEFLTQYPERKQYTTSTSFNKNLISYAIYMGVKFEKTKSNGFQWGEFQSC